MGAKQGAAETPKASSCVQDIYISFFLKALFMSCWSSEITCKLEDYPVPFPGMSPVFAVS